jgi:hypothetical protein
MSKKDGIRIAQGNHAAMRADKLAALPRKGYFGTELKLIQLERSSACRTRTANNLSFHEHPSPVSYKNVAPSGRDAFILTRAVGELRGAALT